jgi:hypothetical protein
MLLVHFRPRFTYLAVVTSAEMDAFTLTNTIKAMLLENVRHSSRFSTPRVRPDQGDAHQDTHRYKSSVTNEVTGTGYTAGGVTLTSKTAVYDVASNTLTLDCADPTWAASTITARYLVFYKDTGTASTSPLIAYVDFGEDRSTGATPFTYTVPTTGIAQFITA